MKKGFAWGGGLTLDDTMNRFLVFFLQNMFRDIRRCFKNCFAEKLAELKVVNDGRPQHG